MNETLTPHEIQIAVFRQLLTYETLLKPQYKMRIDRLHCGIIFTYIVKTDTGNCYGRLVWKLEPANISTSADVDKHLNLFWDDVPNQYKRKEEE